ncbi:phosphopantetheine-binding protein [Fulvivirga maritima]|uniref:acyl carrier protein n=1 Tax=Fulvivirga maritima TaxID=2904247 RepID=UPI001F3CEE0A|nr:phosphopantetheine-binding protein [Fulvivirga maritima]UII27574.1 phosphopantetheine-binding protein [Fulvivirga maritima]
MTEEIKKKIRSIIANDLDANINEEDLSDDVSLYDGGIGLDSIAIINLIVELENKFDISFDETEINAQLFSNINSLADFISGKMNAGVVK